MNKLCRIATRGIFLPMISRYTALYPVERINLCCGHQKIMGYCGLDLTDTADIFINLATTNLPFRDESIDSVICMSAINYFSARRGEELIREIFRVLKRGGFTRFGVQDLELLAKRYIEKD